MKFASSIDRRKSGFHLRNKHQSGFMKSCVSSALIIWLSKAGKMSAVQDMLKPCSPFPRSAQTTEFHRMAAPLRICLLIPILTLLASCSWFGGKSNPTEEKPNDEAPKLVGRIASIPADRKFVLIQSYGSWKIESGTILTTRGPEDRTANLLVTGEAMGQFAAADLQAGSVEIGDAVYSRHVPKPPEPASESTAESTDQPKLPENQLPAETENVQKNN